MLLSKPFNIEITLIVEKGCLQLACIETSVALQHNGPSVGFAMAGGVFLCCGNLATQYALVRTLACN